MPTYTLDLSWRFTIEADSQEEVQAEARRLAEDLTSIQASPRIEYWTVTQADGDGEEIRAGHTVCLRGPPMTAKYIEKRKKVPHTKFKCRTCGMVWLGDLVETWREYKYATRSPVVSKVMPACVKCESREVKRAAS